MRVTPSATSPAKIIAAPARKSVARTSQPVSWLGPSTTALRPSVVILAPIRLSSTTCIKRFSKTVSVTLLRPSAITIIAIICGIPAAYALSRMKFKGQTAFLGFVIISQMFAPVVLLIGIYKVLATMGLTDSILGLVFINAAFNQAFTIWLLRGTFIGISPEMEQAATIDGCNKIQAMFRVLLPVAAPGIVTTLIFIFINAWNEYTVALCIISSNVLKPITVGINIFNGYNMIQWQYLFAASVFAIIPVVIMFMCIEKHLVSGLASGGVKG